MTAIKFIEPLTHEEGVSQVTKLFVDTYSIAPEDIRVASGRVDLIDEHTDYSAGLCLPIALPHHTSIVLKPREDTKVRVASDVTSDKAVEADLDGPKARGVDGWSAHPTGIAWVLRQTGFDKVKGSNAAFTPCVPLGSGLSSSAAMTCSTVLALDDVYDLGYGDSDTGRVTFVNAVIKPENGMTDASTGGLDQNASMRCTTGHALLLDCYPELTPLENVSRQEFDLNEYDLELPVVDTQAPYQLNDGQYAQRRATCEEVAKILGVTNLRVVADGISKIDDQFQALKGALDVLPDETIKKRACRIATEIERMRSFVRAFTQGDIKAAGRLSNAPHDSPVVDCEVTMSELGIAVDVAHKDGAHGARMTSDSFDSSIITLVDKGRSQEVAQKIAGEFEKQGSHVPCAPAAYAMKSTSREA